MKTTKLLLPIDFTPETEHAINYAIELFSEQPKEIVLLHIMDDGNSSEVEAKLVDLQKKYSTDKSPIRYKIEPGKVFDDIGRIAEEINADFVVMGIHETNMMQRLLGSRAVKVITDSKVPFIVVQKHSDPQPIKKIAMTIDIDKDSIQIAKTAAALASFFNSEIVLVGGDHNDTAMRRKVVTNMTVAINHIQSKNIEASHVLLPRDNFMNGFLNYCNDESIDMIAATYYMNNFQILSAKFVQELLENGLNIPVLTIDAQSVRSGSQLSFMTL